MQTNLHQRISTSLIFPQIHLLKYIDTTTPTNYVRLQTIQHAFFLNFFFKNIQNVLSKLQ